MPDSCPNRRGFLLPAALTLAAVAALSVDLPIAMAFKRWNGIAGVGSYLTCLDMLALFGHGLGVVLALAAVHQLDPARRWAMPRLLACALAAGGAADLLKMLIIRSRPESISLAFDGSVWATFGQWWPMLRNISDTQSFPSGHTATAAGLAAALIWLYPQGRWLFTLLAVLVGCQRIVSGAHFPSDVLIGGAAGSLAAMFFLRVGRLPVWFDRWESHWRKSDRR